MRVFGLLAKKEERTKEMEITPGKLVRRIAQVIVDHPDEVEVY